MSKLTPRQQTTLNALARLSTATPRELGRELGHSAQGATRITASLIRAGLATRSRNEHGSVIYTITPAGHALAQPRTDD